MEEKQVFKYEDIEIGEELEASYELNLDLVREYAQGIGDHNPWFLEDCQPLGGAVAHPTLIAYKNLQLVKSKYSLAGCVDVSHEIQFLRPARVGQTIQLKGRLVDKYIKREREYLVVEYLAMDEQGNELCRDRNTLLLRYQKRTPSI
jgi:acyl dehydratase